MCNDLKTGQLVGATPRRQQLMQVLGVVTAALVLGLVSLLVVLAIMDAINNTKLGAEQRARWRSEFKEMHAEIDRLKREHRAGPDLRLVDDAGHRTERSGTDDA